MIESLKNNLPVLNAIGVVVIPTLIVLGILKPISSPKTRMKKKILRKLTEEANKGGLLLPEIMFRDNLLSQRILLKNSIFLEKFYTLFIESMRELESEESIVRVPNSSLAFFFKDIESNYPPHSSGTKKTPADYGLKEDNPRIYLGLNSKETQDHLRELKSRCDAEARRAYAGV